MELALPFPGAATIRLMPRRHRPIYDVFAGGLGAAVQAVANPNQGSTEADPAGLKWS
jgi:hypothetical protein